MARRGRYRLNLNKPAKELRRKEALERQAARALMSDQEKLSALDNTLGPGIGAKKERAKLAARLQKPVKLAALQPATKPESYPEEDFITLHQEGGSSGTTLGRRGDQLILVVGFKKPIPVQSMSQIRRLADQNEFDAAPFLTAYKAHLASTEKTS